MEVLHLNRLLYPEIKDVVRAFKLKISLNIFDLSLPSAFYIISFAYMYR